MKADRAILQLTYSGVIETFSKKENISLREALNKFYNSQIYIEIRDGISDMHCRSDEYLAEELTLEFELTSNSSAKHIHLRN